MGDNNKDQGNQGNHNRLMWEPVFKSTGKS
jgi:hypothetical protein